MVHIVFDPSQPNVEDFIQIGGGLGEISPEYNYFKGAPVFQRGYGTQGGAGVGDVFRGLWRFFLPLIRRVGTTVSAEVLNTGQRALDRVIQGEPVKQALVSEGKRGIDTVLDRGGFPKQFGTGRLAIKGKRKSVFQPSHQIIIGKSKKKQRLRSDVFGSY
jgi:hypothetical protein